MNGRLGMTGSSVVRGDKEVYKARDRKKGKDYSGTAVGTGAVIGTAGLLGGGVPGARPDSGRLAHVRRGTKFAASRHLVSATRGGVFGYRADAHQSFLNRQNADEKTYGGKKTTRVNHYLRGQGSGKIAPEKQIIEHMRAGRVGANYALAGGTALLGAGIQQRKRRLAVAKATKSDGFKADALITGGTAMAVGAGGGSLALDSQGRKWAKRSAASLDEARKLNPKLGGYSVKRTQHRVPDVAPHKGTGANIAEHKSVFAGRSNKDTEAVGRLKGAAGQERYFARVYGSVARRTRQAGAAGALVGAAGLGGKYLQVKPRKVSKAETTMSDAEAHKLSGRYDTRGPLPKGLDRESKMKAYEARYIASGGKKAEKWKRRADHAEVGRNIGLAGATVSGAALLASRGRTGAKLAAKVPKLTPHKIEGAALTSAVGGGVSELYGEHARHRRASYANSPAGIAGSALTRMRAYTPGAKP